MITIQEKVTKISQSLPKLSVSEKLVKKELDKLNNNTLEIKNLKRSNDNHTR